MQERGRQVMGVDQYASAHVFEDLPDGGRIVLDTKDPSDTAGIAAIRRHMRDIEAAFRAGDFTKPFQVHAMTVPGTAAMSQWHDVIEYEAIDRHESRSVKSFPLSPTGRGGQGVGSSYGPGRTAVSVKTSARCVTARVSPPSR